MESLISRTDQVQVRISSLGKVDKLDHLVKEKVQDRKCGNFLEHCRKTKATNHMDRRRKTWAKSTENIFSKSLR